MVDFNKAVQFGLNQIKSSKLALILLGPSGAGKSSICGTLGVRTLFLYSIAEEHGPANAMQFSKNKNVLPYPYDVNISTGEMLSPDLAYKNLLDILKDTEGLKKQKIGAIVVDGATQVETMIQSTTQWSEAVARNYKGNASYAGPITLAMFRPILTSLSTLRKELDIHYVMTGILHVKELGEDGSLLEASPSLAGYNVAEGLIQNFPDVLMIGAMKNPKGILAPRIQLHSSVTKTTSDFKTKEVRKILNCSNRLTGIKMDLAPTTTLPPNLALIAKIKADGKFPEIKKVVKK